MKIFQDFTKYLVCLCCFTLWIKTVASNPATKVWNKSSFSLKFNVPWPELLEQTGNYIPSQFWYVIFI